MLEEPFCNNCGYILTGTTESSKCPECGRPLVEVLTRRNAPVAGKRFTSAVRIFGWPLMQIALGPAGSERSGTARAIVAIGDKALGIVACGGMACGVFCFGGLTLGIFCFGGLAAGLIAMGGVALGGVVAGGTTIGGIAGGGASIGYIIYSAGVAVGYYARGGLVYAVHPLGGRARSASGQQFFSDYAWLFGNDPFGLQLLLWVLAFMLMTAAVIFLVLLAGYLLGQRARSA